MSTLADRLFHSWDEWYPIVLGGISGVAAYLCGPAAFAEMRERGWADTKIYDSVFDIIVVTTPFIFTVYSFVITTERGFIGRMRHSIYFGTLLRYSVTAIWLGAVLMVATVPLQITALRPVSPLHSLGFAIWSALAVCAFAATFRATRLFIVFATHHR